MIIREIKGLEIEKTPEIVWNQREFIPGQDKSFKPGP
jgi:hypothetical protein